MLKVINSKSVLQELIGLIVCIQSHDAEHFSIVIIKEPFKSKHGIPWSFDFVFRKMN